MDQLQSINTAEPSTKAIITLITLLTVLASWKLIKNLVNLPPGPLGLPVVGSLPYLSPELHRYFAHLAKAYGPVFSIRLGSKLCVVLSAPAAAKEALKDKDLILANRDQPAVVRAVTANRNDLVWTSYGPVWRALRKLSVQELLCPASVDAVRPLRRHEVRRTICKLKSSVGKTVEVSEVMFLTSLNIMTTMLWGVEIDGEDESVGKELNEVLVGIINLLATPNVSDFFPLLEVFDLQGAQREMKKLGERYERIVKRIVDEQKIIKEKKVVKTFMDVGMEAFEKSRSDATQQPILSMDNIRGLLLDLVAGSTDTSATTVEWAMSELLHNPDVMRKVQEELDATIAINKVVEESDLPNLTYLNAVVKETLRLHPVVPLLVPHTPSSTCTLGGYQVPVGSRVFINIWAIHRDPSLWDEPLTFKPERFLKTNQKFDFNGSNYSYLPFGSGRRICAGIGLGERMVMYMLASLLHSFHWHLPHGQKLDQEEKFGIVLRRAKPLKVIPSARLDNPELYI